MTQATLNVLVVEDEVVDFLSVERALSNDTSQDYLIHWASSIEGGKRMLKKSEFDAIVLDLGLPDANGVDSVVRINADAPGTPIVVLSGDETPETALGVVKLGAEAYVPKRWLSGHQLNDQICSAVRRHRDRLAQLADNGQSQAQDPRQS